MDTEKNQAYPIYREDKWSIREVDTEKRNHEEPKKDPQAVWPYKET